MLITCNQKKNEFINTWISEEYCPNWGIWEAIREILQNQLDGITEKIGKKNILIEGKKTKNNEESTDYTFFNNSNGEIVGEIKYNEEQKTLIIWNNGKLEKGNLLLGGFKDTNNDEIIGRFGEGMKLSALALCRADKQGTRRRINIFTNDECWKFKIKPDEKFPLNGKPRNCLFWRADALEGELLNKYKDKITVEIDNIEKNIWLEQIDKILWLTTKNVGRKLEAFDNNNNKFGEIFFNEEFMHKIYVKDIFIYDTIKDGTDTYFGFNINCELNRDRNCVPNLNKRNEQTSKILGYILNNFETIKNNIDDYDINYKDKILDLPGIIYNIVLHYNCSSCMGNFLSQYSYELLWKEWDKNNKGLQPVHDVTNFVIFKEKNRIPDDFYHWSNKLSHTQYCYLVNSKNYKSIQTKFNELFQSSKCKEEIPNNIQAIINEITEKINKIKTDFTNNKIKFKNFNGLDKFNYYDNNIDTIYFSDSIFNTKDLNSTRKWMLARILEIYGYNIYILVDKLNMI